MHKCIWILHYTLIVDSWNRFKSKVDFYKEFDDKTSSDFTGGVYAISKLSEFVYLIQCLVKIYIPCQ